MRCEFYQGSLRDGSNAFHNIAVVLHKRTILVGYGLEIVAEGRRSCMPRI